MNTKSILVGVVIGILVGGFLGYASVPAPDYTLYEDQIAQFESQVLSLSGEIGDLEDQLEEAPSQEDYIELQQQVSILEASVNSADYTINRLTEDVSSLELQVISLEASVNSKDYTINLLIEEVASLESELSDIEAPVEFEFVTISFSRPEDTSSLLQYWIGKANVTIQLMVMLITQDELASSLIDAHERGVDIDVIIDDDWYSSSGSDYQDILDAGIDIRGDERGGLMHHKVMIIDGYIVVIGSYNWSASAEDSNDENILILKSTVIANEYIDEFNRILSQTSSQTPTIYYTLIISSSSSGNTIPSGSHSYVAGSSPSVSAIAYSGWDFSYWLLDGENSGSQNPKVVSMDRDHTIRAVFVEEPSSPPSQYTLTISKSGSGSTLPSTEDHSYEELTPVSVTATPSPGWDFDHWILDGQNVGSQNPYVVNMNQNHALVAVFEEESAPPATQYTLTISVSGSGSTTPSAGSHQYDEGSEVSVTVTATAGSGWDFDHWILDGEHVGSQNPYSVTMNEDYTLTAVFEEEPEPEGYVVINEIEQNPPGNDNYGDVIEWVELYNPSDAAVDISGWTLTATGGTSVTKTISQGTILQPGQRKIIGSGSQWLDNSGEKVVLKDDQGAIRNQTPTLDDNENDNRSWQRNPDGSSNWTFKTSTKNSVN